MYRFVETLADKQHKPDPTCCVIIADEYFIAGGRINKMEGNVQIPEKKKKFPKISHINN